MKDKEGRERMKCYGHGSLSPKINKKKLLVCLGWTVK